MGNGEAEAPKAKIRATVQGYNLEEGQLVMTLEADKFVSGASSTRGVGQLLKVAVPAEIMRRFPVGSPLRLTLDVD